MFEVRYRKYGEDRKVIWNCFDWDMVYEKLLDEDVEKGSIECWEGGIKVLEIKE